MTDICQVFELLVLDVLISWHCDVNYEAGLFLIVDQHYVRLIVKQMLVSPDKKVSEDLGVIIPDYFFWLYPPVFTVLKLVLRTYCILYIVYYVYCILLRPHFCVLGLCELAVTTGDMCMLFAQPASHFLALKCQL